MADARWIGVDLGGTKVLAGLFDDDLTLIGTSKQLTNAEGGPQAVFASVDAAVRELMTNHAVDPATVRGMGFGVPGQVVPNSTEIRYAPNLPGFRNLDIKPLCPANWVWPVVLHNDTRMATYGEFSKGAARGCRDVFGIFVGTGVGAGLILNGELYGGFLGHAGEIGHVVVNWKKGTTVEDIAGRKSMMQRARALLEESPKRVRKEWKDVDLDKVKSSKLAEFYQKDDPIAVKLIDDCARTVGTAIASVVNLLSPQCVVIGGGVTESLKESLTERVWEIAQRSILPQAADGMKFLPAALGDFAGITGCAAFAQRKAATT